MPDPAGVSFRKTSAPMHLISDMIRSRVSPVGQEPELQVFRDIIFAGPVPNLSNHTAATDSVLIRSYGKSICRTRYT